MFIQLRRLRRLRRLRKYENSQFSPLKKNYFFGKSHFLPNYLFGKCQFSKIISLENIFFGQIICLDNFHFSSLQPNKQTINFQLKSAIKKTPFALKKTATKFNL